jgi:predicted MFS family arabinose efflux permease
VTPEASGDNGYRWWVVGMLWLVCLMNYADRQAIFSLFPPIQVDFALTNVQLGILGTAFMWAYALCGPVAGWLCDRVSRKRTILAALLFWSLATAATAMARGYMGLVLVRALGGLAEAFYFPAALSLIADYHGAATRSRAMSLHQSGVYVGSVAGGALAAWIGERHGWRFPFVYFGAVGVLLALMLLIALRERPRGTMDMGLALPPMRAEERRPWSSLLTNRSALAVAAIFLGANFVAMIFLSWTPTFLYERFHLTLSMAGFSGVAYLQVSSILGVLAGGWIADRLVQRQCGGRMLAQAGGLLLGTPFLFLTGWVHTLGAVMAAIIGFGLGKGIYDANIWASLYDVIPVNQRGVAVGAMNSLGWVGGGIATVGIAVAASHFGFAACLSATSAIYLVLAAGMFLLARHLRRRSAVDHSNCPAAA